MTTADTPLNGAAPAHGAPTSAAPASAAPASRSAVGAANGPRSGPPVLRCAGVALVREGRELLADVDLTVRPGEHWALLGANGAGKSTLLGLCGAVRHPTRGSVDVLGHRLGRVDVRTLRGWIGHVDPRHPLRSPLTVEEVVLTGAAGSIELVPRWRPTEAQRRRVAELLGLLGIATIRHARWPTLSQGERGRTLIARALVPRPRLLLLDEPATGLDVAARERLLTSVETLAGEFGELASVLVTHHLEDLPVTTTHAMLLRGGRALATGRADDVLTTELVSSCFDHPIAVRREDGRWSARAPRRTG
ncbi:MULTISPECIES: ABC transporter ATP-binding protein [Frankia]|uniref:ABC transporter ATP-binding protein n=1 Tax=Frankia TaxID=1854 RepID=UPI0002F866BD|nr:MULTISPECIES: ATP-binding cassette domain-containing protein [Frankia]